MSRQQKAGRPHLVAATCAPCRPADKTSCPDPDILAKLPSPSLDSAASSVKQTRTRGLPPPGALARASSAEITRDGCRGGGPPRTRGTIHPTLQTHVAAGASGGRSATAGSPPGAPAVGRFRVIPHITHASAAGPSHAGGAKAGGSRRGGGWDWVRRLWGPAGEPGGLGTPPRCHPHPQPGFFFRISSKLVQATPSGLPSDESHRS